MSAVSDIRNELLVWTGLKKLEVNTDLTDPLKEFLSKYWIIPEHVAVYPLSKKDITIDIPSIINSKEFQREYNLDEYSKTFSVDCLWPDRIRVVKPSSHYSDRMAYNKHRVNFVYEGNHSFPRVLETDITFQGSDWDRHITEYRAGYLTLHKKVNGSPSKLVCDLMDASE